MFELLQGVILASSPEEWVEFNCCKSYIFSEGLEYCPCSLASMAYAIYLFRGYVPAKYTVVLSKFSHPTCFKV